MIGEQIRFDLDDMTAYSSNNFRQIHQDLLIVCAAIEYADRRWKRGATRWRRSFQVRVPVGETLKWESCSECLSRTLELLSGDTWNFTFDPWQGESLISTEKKGLVFEKKEIAIAYSEGLDSRCVSALSGSDSEVLRVRVAKSRQRWKTGDRRFDQIPFEVTVRNGPEISQRFRGWKFLAIAAIACQIAGLRRIVIPESGQSALGPVLEPLHNSWPDYRNHPAHVRNMQHLMNTLLEADLKYEQPRLWHTKGETVSEYLTRFGNDHQTDLATTRSCWQTRWNVIKDGRFRQCGLCAACLLRRMSMHFAGVEEQCGTYVFDDLTVPDFECMLAENESVRTSGSMRQHAYAGVKHLQRLAEKAGVAQPVLGQHAHEIATATSRAQDEVLSKLKCLLERHSEEWNSFVGAQGQTSFIRKWI